MGEGGGDATGWATFTAIGLGAALSWGGPGAAKWTVLVFKCWQNGSPSRSQRVVASASPFLYTKTLPAPPFL